MCLWCASLAQTQDTGKRQMYFTVLYLCILNAWTKGPGSTGLNICTGVFQQGPHQADSIKLVNDSVGKERQKSSVRGESREEGKKRKERRSKKEKSVVISIRSFITHNFLLERFKSATFLIMFVSQGSGCISLASSSAQLQPSRIKASIDFSIGLSSQLAFSPAQFLSQPETHPLSAHSNHSPWKSLANARARGQLAYICVQCFIHGFINRN